MRIKAYVTTYILAINHPYLCNMHPLNNAIFIVTTLNIFNIQQTDVQLLSN